ncbi:MAG TPA: TonB-dependent receptor [Caulobacteraceae bacterium]|nr:TonB-dependent receptor [Caulobacteraceae bacterium]
MTRSTILLSASSAIALAFVNVGAAWADAQQANDSGEIVVTATKSALKADQVPQALEVISGQQITDEGIHDVSNLSDITPGVEIGWNSRGPELNVRGVQSTDPTSKGEQDIVFNVDGIPVGRPQLAGLSFFDLEQVNVLKGPQGTLYGLSATGGVINVVSAKPTHQFAASTTVEIGDYGDRRFDGMVNVPVTDKLAIRVAGSVNKVDGFINPSLDNFQTPGHSEPLLGGSDNETGRITAKYDFSSTGSVVVTGTFGHVGGPAPSNSILYNTAPGTGGVFSFNGVHYGYEASGKNRFQVFYNPFGSAGLDDNFANVNAEVKFDLGAVHVEYDGSRATAHLNDNGFNTNNLYCPTGAESGCGGSVGSYNFGNYNSRLTDDSSEIRFSGVDKSAQLQWLIGASYFHEYNAENDIEWQISQSTALPLKSPTGQTTVLNCLATPFAGGCGGPNPQIIGPNIHDSKGVFGQLQYHVTDKLTLIGGLRYSTDLSARYATFSAGPAKSGANIPAYTENGGQVWLNAAGGPCGVSTGPCSLLAQALPDAGTNTTSAVTYLAEATYDLTPTAHFYAQVASGYKGGGFNDYSGSTGGVAPYGEELLTEYEAGYKGLVTDTIHLNADAYYYDYSKYQLTGATLIPQSVQGVVIYTTSVPVTIYGAESELTWHATPNDTFGATLTLEKAFFDKGPHQATAGFFAFAQVPWGGHSLSQTPTVASTLSYDHRFDLGERGNVRFHVNTKLSGSYYEEDLGYNYGGPSGISGNQYTQPGFTRTDASLVYTNDSGKISVEGFVKNLEDGVQMQGAPGGGGAIGTVSVNLPRTYGVRLTLKY